TSERWARKHYPTLTYWSELSRGGHFAALEQPTSFVDEIRSWSRTLD
ncbi:MAG: alpha/beta hydrolase, partial [Williamsia herbipolensis]|nr:alpha/beta hydrolase [Williamsia herbipolensis]